MCGLFGVWGKSPISLAPVLQSLQGRGPDDHGQSSWPWSGGWLQLAHTRLAIQDLTAAGHQPMGSQDGSLQIVFNGEIYNAPELRHELQKSGVRMRSSSDTEVLVEGYGLWGDALWPRLNGIFALAIVDFRRAELTLVRDRFGVKPLLWYRGEDAFAFASELSALRAACMPSHPRIDHHALEAFWQWGSVPAPRTLVQGIESFPPGCLARWRASSSALGWSIDPFASLPDQLLTTSDLSYAEAVEACRVALQAAVTRQLLSDVPVGAFLSGGLDSGAIVSLMCRSSSSVPHTFSLGFAQSANQAQVADERGLARLVAKKCGSIHHELVIDTDEAVAQVSEFCVAIDQPSVDGFNTFLVTRAARDFGLRVALSGLGGDELMAGYPVFHRAWSYMQSPHLWRSWQGRLPWRVQQRCGWQPARFQRGSVEALAAHRRLHPCSLLRNDHRQVEGWILSEIEQQLDPIAQLSRLEIRGYMRNTLLRDSDAVTMHQGLELRVPFLDHPLADLLLRLPSAYKIRAGCNKPLLIDAIADDLPVEILSSPKRGFELPFASWLEKMQAPPLDSSVLGALWPSRVRSAQRRFQRRSSDYHGWWQWQILSRWLLSAWPELLHEDLSEV